MRGLETGSLALVAWDREKVEGIQKPFCNVVQKQSHWQIYCPLSVLILTPENIKEY